MLRNLACILTTMCCLTPPALAQSPQQLIQAMEWVDLSVEDFAERLLETFPGSQIVTQGGLEQLPESTDDPLYWYLEATVNFGASNDLRLTCVRLGERTHQHLVAIDEDLSKDSGWVTYPSNAFGANLPLEWNFKTLVRSSSHVWPSRAISRLGCDLIGEMPTGTIPSLDEVKVEMKEFFGDVPFISLIGGVQAAADETYDISNASPASKDVYLFESAFVRADDTSLILTFRSFELFSGT